MSKSIYESVHFLMLDAGTCDTQASLPGGERHAAVGTEYLQSVATMVRIWQPPGCLLASTNCRSSCAGLVHDLAAAHRHSSQQSMGPLHAAVLAEAVAPVQRQDM